MKKIIFSIIIVLTMVSCANTIKQNNTPWSADYSTGIDYLDSLVYTKWLNIVDTTNDTEERYSFFDAHNKDITLHLKYEANILYLYNDISDIRKYDNVVYTDFEYTVKHKETGMPMMHNTDRYFYNKDNGEVIIVCGINQEILYEVNSGEEIKTEMENQYKDGCVMIYTKLNINDIKF